MDEHQHGRDEAERVKRSTQTAASARIQFQGQWVEQQLRIAQEQGKFDNLPGAGKPIEGLGSQHDPDWWLKKLVEREQLSLLPPALSLRKEHAELADTLDRFSTESEVRRELDDFNERVRRARMQLEGGPPVVTPLRDVDEEIAAWRERREARIEAQRAAIREREVDQPRRGWFRRLFG